MRKKKLKWIKKVLQYSATQGIIPTELISHGTMGAWFIAGFKKPLGSWVCSKLGPSFSQEKQQEFWCWH